MVRDQGPFTLTPEAELKTQHLMVILGLCLKKRKNQVRIGKSHGYLEVIVLKKVRFRNVIFPDENVKPAFSTSSCLRGVFEKSSVLWRISVDGWLDQLGEIKQRFQIPPYSLNSGKGDKDTE